MIPDGRRRYAAGCAVLASLLLAPAAFAQDRDDVPQEGAAAEAPAGPDASAASDAPAAKRRSILSRLPLVGRFFGRDEDPDGDGDRVAPHYALEIDAPEPVARQIRDFTLLGRWRNRADFDPSQLPLFVRRAEGEVLGLLAAEGWFSAQVTVTTIDGGVRIAVDAGTRTRVRDVTLDFAGYVEAPSFEDLRERVRRQWSMQPGAAFRSVDWERAKRELLGGLSDAGFLRVRIDDSEAIVDREEAAASLRVDVDSGPPLRFGAIEIGGLSRYPPVVVQGLATFGPGDPFSAERLAQYQTRLNGAGWFSTVNVRPDTAALERDPTLERVPVRIDVVERQAKRWTVGGGYDTDRGFSVLTGWEYRNVLGLGVQTFNGFEIDQQRQVLFTTWETPQDLAGLRWQFGARAERRDIQNDLTDAGLLFVSRNLRRGDDETALSLQYQIERQNIVFGPGDETDSLNRALVPGVSWTRRRLDSPLFPTRGYIVSAQVSGASRALASDRDFVRAYGFGYGIVPLSGADRVEFGRLVLRGEIGNVFASGRDGIPSANLFRTGGARSIRGYGSQTIGVDIGQAIVGGRVLAVGSVEYQHLVTREVAIAAFYDRGDAADSWGELRTVAGYGLGVRWRTPVGPLNLDLAWGDAEQALKVHFSIGVVF